MLTNIISEKCPTFALFKSVFRLHLLCLVFKLCALKVKGLENFRAFPFCLKLRVNVGMLRFSIAFIMEVSSESPRVLSGIEWGFITFLCSRGRAFAIHLCPGVGAFLIDINSRNFQMLTIFIIISSSTFYSKVPPFIQLVS